jgi:hypothetical protein
MIGKMLDNLREKPEPYRRAIAFWSALGITAIISLVWVSSLGERFGSSSAEKPIGDSPFSQLSNAISSIFD